MKNEIKNKTEVTMLMLKINKETKELVGWLKVIASNPGMPYVAYAKKMAVGGHYGNGVDLGEMVTEGTDVHSDDFEAIEDILDDLSMAKVADFPGMANAILTGISDINCHVPTVKEISTAIQERRN